MQIALREWGQVRRRVRRAFIYVTLHNSRDKKDLRLAQEFIDRLSLALEGH